MILRLWQETCMPFLEVSRGLSRAASPTGLAGNFNKGARILFWSWTCDLFRSWNLHEVTQKEHKKHTFCPWKMSKSIKSPWSLEVNSAPPAFLSHFLLQRRFLCGAPSLCAAVLTWNGSWREHLRGKTWLLLGNLWHSFCKFHPLNPDLNLEWQDGRTHPAIFLRVKTHPSTSSIIPSP